MAKFVLRVRTRNGQQVVDSLTPDSTAHQLYTLLSQISQIPERKLNILSGYPPKQLLITLTESLAANGIVSGDTLILQEAQHEDETSISTSANDASDRHLQQQESSNVSGILMKQVVPADNSCLFTSIHFVISGKLDETGAVAPWMRNLIAETVSNDPDVYSDAILGKPNSEYCKWIKEENSWGGGIEIAVLSNHYGIEIAVVDTVNAIINRFGEDKSYGQRVFLLFDGIHYDPLYLESTSGGCLQTIFRCEDERVLKEAEQLAIEAKSSRQFTDVNKFTLKCNDCDLQLQGQREAQLHAQQTGHANFGEQ